MQNCFKLPVQIIDDMLKLFRKPHPFIFNYFSILIPSIITFLLIIVLAPFHFREMELSDRCIGASIISALVALSIFITVHGLRICFPRLMSEDNWTIGKEFLLFLFVTFIIAFLICIVLFIFAPYYTSVFHLIFNTIILTLSISIFPILILILFEQYQHQKKQLYKAHQLTQSLQNTNKVLAQQTKKQSSNNIILLRAENNEIALQLDYRNLIYTKSDGNYVEVYYNNNDKIQKKLIRNRLKKMEQLLPQTSFFRCHNSFIINGNHILKVEGNARNLVIHLKGISETIPVSRAKAKMITTFIENLS